MLVTITQPIWLLIMIHNCCCFSWWNLINHQCQPQLRSLVGASFASKFQGFVSNHQNNSKHIETPYVKGVWWILPLFGWCGLQMCFELVVDIIMQIPYYYQVGKKHILNIPTSQIEIVTIFPLLESSHHFAYVISKLKILKF
jgi:hypothetical protein